MSCCTCACALCTCTMHTSTFPFFPSFCNKPCPFYRYFNVPVETAQDAKANPLRALKSLGSVDDFIVVKVDIDTPSIEEPLIAQILDDEGLSELIDELYFERHVLLSPMSKWWATGLNDTGCAVQDSYALFHALRQRGIRAHSWV